MILSRHDAPLYFAGPLRGWVLSLSEAKIYPELLDLMQELSRLMERCSPLFLAVKPNKAGKRVFKILYK